MGAGWLALRLDNVGSALVNLESAAPTEYRGGSMRIFPRPRRGWLGPTCAREVGRG